MHLAKYKDEQQLVPTLCTSRPPLACAISLSDYCQSAVQIGLCEQLLSHLGKYQQQHQDREQAASTPSNQTPSTEAAVPFEGMKAVKKEASDGFEGAINPVLPPYPLDRHAYDDFHASAMLERALLTRLLLLLGVPY